MTPNFPDTLRHRRTLRRLSQLHLALAAGISQRHLSFLESGRSQPSRTMVLQLCESLSVPLRERNQWLRAAGFAPIFQSRPLDHPQMSQVLDAVNLILDNHQPYPAMAMDRCWNVHRANQPFQRLIKAILQVHPIPIPNPPNLIHLFFHPDGLRPWIANWASAAPLLWCRAQREANASHSDDLRALLASLSPHLPASVLRIPEETPLLPVLPVDLHLGDITLSLFSLITSFGTPQDLTADELKLETLFPANSATKQYFQSLAA